MAVALPFIGMGLQVASTLVAYNAARMQGEATASAEEYNAKLATQNAKVAEAQGVAADEALARDQRKAIGAMVAGYGASGVQLTDGSPADVLAESARMATLDRLTQKYNYKLKALGFQNQASLHVANAANARTAGKVNSTAALLNGASKMGSSFGSNFGS